MRLFKNAQQIIKLALVLLLVGVGWFVLPAGAQDVISESLVEAERFNLPGNGILGIDDLRLLIVRVVQILLTLVGLAAVLVVIYGGWLWMTARGNDDQVKRAKKVLINGLIGLVLIISSYFIVQLVVGTFTDLLDPSTAESCTVNDTQGCGSCGGVRTCDASGKWGACVSGGLCPEDAPFGLQTYTPTGSDNPVNSVVTMKFKMDVETLTATSIANFDIKARPTADAAAVPTTVAGAISLAKDSDGNDQKDKVVFVPSAVCTEDTSQNCFAKNSTVTVTVSDSLRSANGVRLTCPLTGCTWTFEIGESFDAAAPTISYKKPRRTVPIANSVLIEATVRDDFKVGATRFTVSGGSIFGSTTTPPYTSVDQTPLATSPRTLNAKANWNTSTLLPRSTHTIKTYANDVAGRSATPVTETVMAVAAHCVNGVQDADKGETDIDCGGSGCDDCGAPIITNIEPADAAPGDFVQITGRNFGDEPGKVIFAGIDMQFETPAIDDRAGLTPLACSAVDTWTPTQILIEVPTFAVDTNSDGVDDASYLFDTNLLIENSAGKAGDTLAWTKRPIFINTNIKRPSLCSASPTSLEQCAVGAERELTVVGRKFVGDNANPGNVLFGNLPSSVQTWTATPSRAVTLLPNIEAGDIKVRAQNTNAKYCVGGLNAWALCTVNGDCDSDKCDYAVSNPVTIKVNSCAARPVITSVDPTSGPNEQVITVIGSNFGRVPRQLLFVNAAGATVEATFNFPEQCSLDALWKDNQIVAKVPARDKLAPGTYDLIVRLTTGTDPLQSEPVKFVVNTAEPTPALFCALPDNGPIGTKVTLVGDVLGANKGKVIFKDSKEAGIDEWKKDGLKVVVPEGAVTGGVVAINSAAKSSNAIGFEVGSCTNSSCGSGKTCCGDGVCRVGDASACPVPPAFPISSYRWRITTGYPAPRVVESSQCLVNMVANGGFENYDALDDGTLVAKNWTHPVNPPQPLNLTVNNTESRTGRVSFIVEPGNFSDIVQTLSLKAKKDAPVTLSFWMKGAVGDGVSVFINETSTPAAEYSEPVVLTSNNAWQKIVKVITPAYDWQTVELRFELGADVRLDDIAINLGSDAPTYQSPSPYKQTQDACVNAALATRFTTQISNLGSVKLENCGNDRRCVTSTAVGVTVAAIGTDGVRATPSSILATDTWYKATISGVKSDKGVEMDAPYSWTFKTGATACAVAGASCSPQYHQFGSSSAVGVQATASLQALNCNVLQCAAGDVSWNKAGDNVVNLGTSGVCSVPVSVGTAFKEGKDKVQPVVRGASADIKTNMCEFEVKFAPLEVKGVFPNCNEACTNSIPLIALSTPVKSTSVNGYKVLDPSLIKIEKCTNEACTTVSLVNLLSTILAPSDNWSKDELVGLNLPYLPEGQYIMPQTNGDLDEYAKYKVTIKGGNAGITSLENKKLSNGNEKNGDYSWIFKTAKKCEVDRLSLAPEAVTVRTLGAKVEYVSSLFGKPDKCASGGQLLKNTAYDYEWATANANVASISTIDRPPTDGLDDPIQEAVAVGKDASCSTGESKCMTKITSKVLPSRIGDDSDFTLQCGFKPAGACVPSSSDLAVNGNFEAGKTEDNKIDEWEYLSSVLLLNEGKALVSTGGAKGSYYLRALSQDECDDGDLCQPLLKLDGLKAKSSEIKYKISFFAKKSKLDSESNPEVRTDGVPIVALRVGAQTLNINVLSDQANHELSDDWKYYSGDVVVPVNVTDQIYLAFGDDQLIFRYDIDGVTVVPSNCSNNTTLSCSTDSQCNVGNSANLCGVAGNPDGTCSIPVGSTEGTCSNEPQVACTTNSDCKLAVNNAGCCAVRPYVKAVDYATYQDGDTFMCPNTAFVVKFSNLIDPLSINDNIKLQWEDNVDGDCNLSTGPAAWRQWFSKIANYVKSWFGADASAQNIPKWCDVQIGKNLRSVFNTTTGLPINSEAVITFNELLSGSLKYRLLVTGESTSLPYSGVRSVYGVSMSGDYEIEIPDDTEEIGNKICEIKNVEVTVQPPLPRDTNLFSSTLRPTDLFKCAGEGCVCPANEGDQKNAPGCRLTTLGYESEDKNNPTTATPESLGNQHKYMADATDEKGNILNANFTWDASEEFDPVGIINDTLFDASTAANDSEKYATISSDLAVGNTARKYALGKVKVSASHNITSGPATAASNTINVVYDSCKNRWSWGTPTKNSITDPVYNFSTTYCLDKEDGELPNFAVAEVGANANLNITKEWILSKDNQAIALRLVQNPMHLTPLQWYNEQSFAKGSPEMVQGGVDGYDTIIDGRTAYIGFANATNDAKLYSNILIISHSQNANADTVEVFKQLMDNLTFNTNKITAGQCRSKTLVCTEGAKDKIGSVCEADSECSGTNPVVSGVCSVATQAQKGCFIDSDCAGGFICTSDKSKITRDLKRMTSLMDMRASLLDYQYGSQCSAVTPGAPGDADCNGVINGQDVVRAGVLLTQKVCTAGDASRIGKSCSVASECGSSGGVCGLATPSCRGGDTDETDGPLTLTDLGNVRRLVDQSCTRPASRTTNFPSLKTGSFVENMTTSVWPSWQDSLAKDLATDLPLDPINLFSACGVKDSTTVKYFGGTYSPYTCWDPNSKTYASYNAILSADKSKITSNAQTAANPPVRLFGDIPQSKKVGGIDLGSHVFTYASPSSGADFAICGYFEYSAVPTPAVYGQQSGAQNRVCILSSSGITLPTPPPYAITVNQESSSFVDAQTEVKLTVKGGAVGTINMGSVKDCVKNSLRETTCVVYIGTVDSLTLSKQGDASVSWSGCSEIRNEECFVNHLSSSRKSAYNITATLSDSAKLTISSTGLDRFSSNEVSYGLSINGKNKSSCPSEGCAVELGSEVVITPNVGSEALFGAWTTGSVCEKQGFVCKFTMTTATDISFSYSERKRFLQVELNAIQGDFGGNVVSAGASPVININPASCGSVIDNPVCRDAAFFVSGATVTLTATPSVATSPVVWSGCDNVVGNACEMTMTKDKIVRVRFGNATPSIALTKIGGPTANVTTDSVSPAGQPKLECGSGCTTKSQVYEVGSKVVLRAVAASGQQFTGWSVPSCGTSVTCEVTVSASGNAVTASFATPSATIKIKRSAVLGGSVSVAPVVSGSPCSGNTAECVISVPTNTPITITSTASTGYELTDIVYTQSGLGTFACTGGSFASGCGVGNLNANQTVELTVNFRAVNRTLSVVKTGNGTIESYVAAAKDGRINCGAACSYSYPNGTAVELRAVANVGNEFVGWTGCDSTTGGNCQVNMSAAKNVTANFKVKDYIVNVNVVGPSGSVVRMIDNSDGRVITSFGGPITNTTVPHGINVRFEALPIGSVAFTGWSGGTLSCTTNANCADVINVTSEINGITATFAATHSVTIKKQGGGTGSVVNLSLNGVVNNSCTKDVLASSSGCVLNNVSEGTDIVFTATPDTANAVEGLGGCTNFDSSTSVCRHTVSSTDSTVIIDFNAAPVVSDATLELQENGILVWDGSKYNFKANLFVTDADTDELVKIVVKSVKDINGNNVGSATCNSGASAKLDGNFTCSFDPNDDNFSGKLNIEVTVVDVTAAGVTINTAVNDTMAINIVDINDLPVVTAKCRVGSSGSFNLCSSATAPTIADGGEVQLECSFIDPDVNQSHNFNITPVAGVLTGTTITPSSGILVPSSTSVISTINLPSRNALPISVTEPVEHAARCSGSSPDLLCGVGTYDMSYELLPNHGLLVMFSEREFTAGKVAPTIKWKLNGEPSSELVPLKVSSTKVGSGAVFTAMYWLPTAVSGTGKIQVITTQGSGFGRIVSALGVSNVGSVLSPITSSGASGGTTSGALSLSSISAGSVVIGNVAIQRGDNVFKSVSSDPIRGTVQRTIASGTGVTGAIASVVGVSTDKDLDLLFTTADNWAGVAMEFKKIDLGPYSVQLSCTIDDLAGGIDQDSIHVNVLRP